MKHYSPEVKEEARLLFLGAIGRSIGYRPIAEKINEQYPDCSISHTTVRGWALKEGWLEEREKHQETIRTNTNQTITDLLQNHSSVLGKSLQRYVQLLDNKQVDIRPSEAVLLMKQLERLSGADNARSALIGEISKRLPTVLDRAGLTVKQQEAVIREWVRDMRES